MNVYEKMKGVLRQRLECLSPKARLRLVVSVFTAFAVCCVFQFVTAIVNFGTDKAAEYDMRHIESVSLPDDGQGVNNILKDIEEWRKKK